MRQCNNRSGRWRQANHAGLKRLLLKISIQDWTEWSLNIPETLYTVDGCLLVQLHHMTHKYFTVI